MRSGTHLEIVLTVHNSSFSLLAIQERPILVFQSPLAIIAIKTDRSDALVTRSLAVPRASYVRVLGKISCDNLSSQRPGPRFSRFVGRVRCSGVRIGCDPFEQLAVVMEIRFV